MVASMRDANLSDLVRIMLFTLYHAQCLLKGAYTVGNSFTM